MDTVNIHNHNQMEQYDFSKPINVTIIFEDCDDEFSDKEIKKETGNEDNNLTVECLNAKQQPEESNIRVDVTNNMVWIADPLKEETVIIEQSINNTVIDATDDSTGNIQATNNITHVTDTDNTDQNMEHMSNQNPLIGQNTTCDSVGKGDNNTSDHQNGNNHEELDDYIDALLNVVSENLILIIRPYHYYYHRNKEVTEDIKNYLNKLKIHFFDLSYSSVVTLILPQEKNEKFVKNFIDKTVVIANKVLTWKCGRKNVEPFYNEMIIWTKKKRDHITKLKTQSHPSNYNKRTNGSKTQENRILKEHLSNPPKQFHIAAPVGAIAVNPSDQNFNTENRNCILEPLGREITINIDSEMIHAHANQYNNNNHHVNEMCRNTHNSANFYAPNVQLASSQAQYNYNVTQQNIYHQNNTLHYKPPPPPYNNNQNHINTNPYYVYRNHIQENMAQNIQTQRNFNQFVAPVHSNSNCGQLYSTHFKEQMTPVNSITQLVQHNNYPVITSVVSINTRCCICGKTALDTRTRCSKCNKQVYCGNLCQELDAGSHNTLCGKT